VQDLYTPANAGYLLVDNIVICGQFDEVCYIKSFIQFGYSEENKQNSDGTRVDAKGSCERCWCGSFQLFQNGKGRKRIKDINELAKFSELNIEELAHPNNKLPKELKV
jgi:hypothetical protein